MHSTSQPTPNSRLSDETFDTFVYSRIRRFAGEFAPVVDDLFSCWQRGPGGLFLDYLLAREVIERVAARALRLAWEGSLDERDARQLVDADNIQAHFRRAGAALCGTVASSSERQPETRPVGSYVGRYPIKGILGRGGFGIVYLGIHPTLRIPVALKPVWERPENDVAGLTERLLNEARLQARVQHPNVVRVWDYEEGMPPFLVLEYVHGENLADRLTQGPLEPRTGFILAAQMTLALRAALRQGVLHRDVKPANILLTPEGGFKLADFGLAHCRTHTARAVRPGGHALTARAWGTQCYMAPEQAEGSHDQRSDMYSLGMVLWHALTGELPNGTIPPGHPDSPPLHRKVLGLPVAVSAVVRRLCAAHPDDRFRDYDALFHVLEQAFDLRLDAF